jgi:stage II sporulation protein M
MTSVSNFIANFKEQHRPWGRIIVWLFAIGAVIGAVTAVAYPDLMARIVEGFAERFGESPELDENLALQIFIQNITVSIVAWLGGIALGLIPVAVVLVNGFILGYVIGFVGSNSVDAFGSLIFLAAGLVPHAIFELPAFLIACVLGLKIGWAWLAPTAKGNRMQVLENAFLPSFKYMGLVTLALAIAAIIEVFISGKLVGNS